MSRHADQAVPLFPSIAVAAGIAGIALMSGLGWWVNSLAPSHGPVESHAARIPAPRPVISGRFSLVDGDGRIVTQNSFAGRWTVIYFGYGSCPDVCPTELSHLAQAVDLLGPELGAKVQPAFITVDPERDTPSRVKDYAALFHPRMVGLTGTPDLVAEAIRSFAVYAAKRPVPGSSGYSMDHSSYFYLLGPDGQFRGRLTGGMTPEGLAATLRDRMSQPAAVADVPALSGEAPICTWDNTPVPEASRT